MGGHSTNCPDTIEIKHAKEAIVTWQNRKKSVHSITQCTRTRIVAIYGLKHKIFHFKNIILNWSKYTKPKIFIEVRSTFENMNGYTTFWDGQCANVRWCSPCECAQLSYTRMV